MTELVNSSTFENRPRSYGYFSQGSREERTSKEPITDPYLSSIHSPLDSTAILGRCMPGVQEIYSSAVSPEISAARQIWQDRGISTLHLATIHVQKLAAFYALREPIELVQFFRIHLSLIPLLLELYHKVKLYFSDAQMFLEFVVDSDTIEKQSSNGDLVVSIVTRLNPVDAVKNLEQFYEQWWLYTSPEIQDKGKICFNLECV